MYHQIRGTYPKFRPEIKPCGIQSDFTMHSYTFTIKYLIVLHNPITIVTIAVIIIIIKNKNKHTSSILLNRICYIHGKINNLKSCVYENNIQDLDFTF